MGNRIMSSIIRATTTSGLQVAPDNSGSLQLQTNGTTAALTIDTSQNVGIGTTSPSTKLTVNSNTALPSAGAVSGTTFWNVGADSTLGNILIDSFAAGSGIIGRRAQGTAAAPSAVTATNNLMRVLGYGYGTSSYSSSSRVSMDFQPDETWTDTAQGTKIQFLTTTNGTTTTAERMRIDSSGNVGIGSTAPLGKLDVWQANGPTTNLVNTNYKTTTPRLAGEIDFRSGGDTSERTDAVASIAGYDAYVGGSYLGELRFYTQNGSLSERMRIDSNGIITGTAGNLMLVSATSQATTSGTFKDFTGIPSWAKKITVMLSGVSTSGTSNQRLQLGISTGVVTSGYLATLTGLTGSASTSNITAGFDIGQGASAAGVLNGVVTFALLDSTNGTWSASGNIGFSNTTRNSVISGSVVLSGTLDRVRITTANGTDTFDAGSINILYE